MLYNQILVRYGDLTLKGKNLGYFIRKVYGLVCEKLEGLNVNIRNTHDYIFIELNDVDHNEVIKRLDLVSGLHSYSLVCRCECNMDDIKKLAKELMNEVVTTPKTFKVVTKRADKNFPLSSLEISRHVAGCVLANHKMLKVDVHNPEITLHVEVRKDGCYLYNQQIKGLGGYPVGVAGKGFLMLSGGIDSPVAGFLAMKQGVEVECVHFESTPLTSIESAQKVIDLVKKMAKYGSHNKITVHMVPFKELHMALLENIPDSYTITIMRRMMYRIASKLAQKKGALCLINGESVGQVASQTLESMNVINSVTNIPVLRPVCTYDKQDIIDIAKKIDTFDISIRPFEDCCTVYLPKSPATAPKLEKCLQYESKFNFEEYVDFAVENTKSIDISVDSDLELPLLGLEVRNTI